MAGESHERKHFDLQLEKINLIFAMNEPVLSKNDFGPYMSMDQPVADIPFVVEK